MTDEQYVDVLLVVVVLEVSVVVCEERRPASASLLTATDRTRLIPTTDLRILLHLNHSPLKLSTLAMTRHSETSGVAGEI